MIGGEENTGLPEKTGAADDAAAAEEASVAEKIGAAEEMGATEKTGLAEEAGAGALETGAAMEDAPTDDGAAEATGSVEEEVPDKKSASNHAALSYPLPRTSAIASGALSCDAKLALVPSLPAPVFPYSPKETASIRSSPSFHTDHPAELMISERSVSCTATRA